MIESSAREIKLLNAKNKHAGDPLCDEALADMWPSLKLTRFSEIAVNQTSESPFVISQFLDNACFVSHFVIAELLLLNLSSSKWTKSYALIIVSMEQHTLFHWWIYLQLYTLLSFAINFAV